MNGREYFHESVVRDIVDILTSVKDYDEVQFLKNSSMNRSFKSITSATKDLILTFPVLVSSDADPATACMIAKAQEKKCASLLHMLFTAICVDSNEDVFDYVRKFHTNIGSMDGSLEDYTDSLDRLAASLEGYEFVGKIDKPVLNAVLEDLKQSNYTLPDDVKETGLDEYSIIPAWTTGGKMQIVHEYDKSLSPAAYAYSKAKEKYEDRISNLQGVIDNKDNIIARKNDSIRSANIAKGEAERRNASLSDQNNSLMLKNRDLKNQLDTAKNASMNGGGRNNDSDIKNSLDYAKWKESSYKAHDLTILNNEYKKANELQPTMMVVNFIQKGEAGSPSMATTAVIGIKCKVYPVSSSDICRRIISKIEDKNVLNSFIRATTNEIGFFRDFLFAIDKAKIDAMSYGRSSTSNKLWKVLERRSTKSKFRRALKMSNDATAISTLVLTENDVDYLKKNDNIDMEKPVTARKILDAYNFMCIVIANESIETASFLYDTGDDNYERLTFSNLEREASDNGYKKIVNLLTKMNR